jgi:hypothetical protein
MKGKKFKSFQLKTGSAFYKTFFFFVTNDEAK